MAVFNLGEGQNMFGRNKIPTAKEVVAAEQLGHKIATEMNAMIDRYIDIVFRFAVSGWLQQMASRVGELTYEHPDDFSFVQEKHFILKDFLEQLDEITLPFEGQILEFIQRDFAFVLENPSVGPNIPVRGLISKKFDDEKDRVAQSASYVLGLSERLLKESKLI